MDLASKALIKELKDAGLSDEVIKAAWPSWWSDEAASIPSARAELRFSLSRRLGLEPQSLLGERVEFVWQEDTRFKNLSAGDAVSRGALASFGNALGRLLLRATPPVRSLETISAVTLRNAILSQRSVVDLVGLISACWGLGVPVIHLRVFPLRNKAMRAMIVEVKGRHVILLGRDALYPAPIAFTLAHEIGHAALGHIGSNKALIDIGDSSFGTEDREEHEADRYGIELLTGSAEPLITTNIDNFSARGLAEACLRVGPSHGIEPGTLALCTGYVRDDWVVANAALHHVYSERKPVWREVNSMAASQLIWKDLSEESEEYLRSIMGNYG